MSVNLKRFVDIRLEAHVQSQIVGVRDTVVLYTNELPTGSATFDEIVSSYANAQSKCVGMTSTLAYLKVFFNNDGVKARVIGGTQILGTTTIPAVAAVAIQSEDTSVVEGKTYYTRASSAAGAGYLNDGTYAYTAVAEPSGNPSTIPYYELTNEGADEKTVTNASIFAETLKTLGNEYIYIAYADSITNASDVYVALKVTAQTLEDDDDVYGINEKVILARAIVNTDSDSVKNFAVKYSSVLGAEMTMGAYLSTIDVYKADSVYDYMFTKETITAETLTDEQYGDIITNNMNVDITLANAVRNCGGNCKNGADFVNNFCRIVLTQTLTDRLVELLSQKIKNASGLSKMYTVMSQELMRYVNSGYLTVDKIWTDEDLVVTYGTKQYTIIEKGTALDTGFAIKILPFTDLTPEDKAAHKAPPTYVVIADQYGIRAITVVGEVI